MAQCLIALGSNVGDREQNLRAAWEHVGRLPHTQASQISRFFRTQPAGGPQQDDFLNACCVASTTLSPHDLLERLQAIESQLGRVRDERWGPRAIDLDLLLYDNLQIDSPTLTLPHPRMSFRRFVLEPAVEVAPNWIHPTSGWSLARLLKHVNSAANRVAIVSSDSPLLDTLVVSGNKILSGGDDGSALSNKRWTIEGYPSLREMAATASPPKLVIQIASPGEESPADAVAGPSLRLVTRSTKTAMAEVLAAIQAMQ